jgi:hypothetical protein
LELGADLKKLFYLILFSKVSGIEKFRPGKASKLQLFGCGQSEHFLHGRQRLNSNFLKSRLFAKLNPLLGADAIFTIIKKVS